MKYFIVFIAILLSGCLTTQVTQLNPEAYIEKVKDVKKLQVLEVLYEDTVEVSTPSLMSRALLSSDYNNTVRFSCTVEYRFYTNLEYAQILYHPNDTMIEFTLPQIDMEESILSMPNVISQDVWMIDRMVMPDSTLAWATRAQDLVMSDVNRRNIYYKHRADAQDNAYEAITVFFADSPFKVKVNFE